MPSRIPRVYWDANVFLSYIDGTVDRLPHIEALFREAEQEKIEIVTSTASITEVAYGSVEMDEREPYVLTYKRRFKTCGRRPHLSIWWRLVCSVLVVEDARKIMRAAIPKGTKVPKPMDAIHLSTAIRMEVDVFHSYDKPLREIASRNGLTADEPSASSPLLFTD